nr:HNH endonuclease [Metabacillus flavus]
MSIENLRTSKEIEKSEIRIPQSTYKERLGQTPLNNGAWTGERGESKFISENNEAQEILANVGEEGVNYSNAIPDFSPVTKHEIEIPNMTTDRSINFREADNKLAKELGVTRKEIVKMRKELKLTWHELNDMKSMQLVPTVINSKFGHLGGVGEIKKLIQMNIFEED